MMDVTLQQLLEAGCHFGHKSERWHPRAAEFIYTEKDGIHIIDLAKTRDGLLAAAQFVYDTVAAGGEVLFIGTKRQAKAALKAHAQEVGAPFFSERWIGGFLTNWESIHKNIKKINRMDQELATGGWKKFPKHEQSKMTRYLTRLKVYYEGVLNLEKPPVALFVIDVRKEVSAVLEACRIEVPVVGVVDTNADPRPIKYAIPANDDAVGSVELIVTTIAQAYKEGKEARAKLQADEAAKAQAKEEAKTVEKPQEVTLGVKEAVKVEPAKSEAPATATKPRTRAKKQA